MTSLNTSRNIHRQKQDSSNAVAKRKVNMMNCQVQTNRTAFISTPSVRFQKQLLIVLIVLIVLMAKTRPNRPNRPNHPNRANGENSSQTSQASQPSQTPPAPDSKKWLPPRDSNPNCLGQNQVFCL